MAATRSAFPHYASTRAAHTGEFIETSAVRVMDVLRAVRLTELMELTTGSPEMRVGLIDGPVDLQHVGLATDRLQEIRGSSGARCTDTTSAACLHGTFIAGILSAKRGTNAPAICPNCTLLVRPIFAESVVGPDQMPTARPDELAVALIECMDAGARVINLSLALAQPSTRAEPYLEDALSRAAGRGVIVVAAAGNQGTIGSTAITRHPWVIPVVASDLRGRPIKESNLGRSIGERGLSAPGRNVTSLGPDEQSVTLGGTSVAVPFVTGTVALLLSAFPTATAGQIKLAVTQAFHRRRVSVVPFLLDAGAAFEILRTTFLRR